MNIIIYIGQSQYDALTLFAVKLGSSLKKMNCNVHFMNLLDNDFLQVLGGLIETSSIDLIIAFNGIGSDIRTDDNVSIYDVKKIYYLSIYVDHPCYHMERLTNYSQYNLASFVDKKHIDFIRKYLPNVQKLSFFLPHGGIEYEEVKNFTLGEYRKNKSIDLLFAGSYMGEPDYKNRDMGFAFLGDFIDLLIEDDYLSVDEAIEIVEKKHFLAFSNLGKVQMAMLYSKGLSFVRQYRRYVVLKKLFESSIPITIYGNGDYKMASKYKNVNYCNSLGSRLAIW